MAATKVSRVKASAKPGKKAEERMPDVTDPRIFGFGGEQRCEVAGYHVLASLGKAINQFIPYMENDPYCITDAFQDLALETAQVFNMNKDRARLAIGEILQEALAHPKHGRRVFEHATTLAEALGFSAEECLAQLAFVEKKGELDVCRNGSPIMDNDRIRNVIGQMIAEASTEPVMDKYVKALTKALGFSVDECLAQLDFDVAKEELEARKERSKLTYAHIHQRD